MAEAVKVEPNKRLMSLDILRGFDMIWIMGGYGFFNALSKVVDWKWVDIVSEQLEHVSWNGFHFFDLIFPLFMFISGVAIPFAITSKLEKGVPKNKLIVKIFRRMILLILLGLVKNNLLTKGFDDLRIAGVLAQIGIAYFFAALVVIHTTKIKVRVYWILGILAIIAVFQLLVPVPGFGAGVLTPEGSINAWIDQHFLPGRLYFGTYDPEGILCIVSAVSVTLMGSLAGNILRNKNLLPSKKATLLSIAGVSLILVAVALSPWYPIIKKNWTVPFDLLAAGISMTLLSLFYFIIDIKGWKKGTSFFKVFGLNSITIYMAAKIFDFKGTSEHLLGALANLSGEFNQVVIYIGVIALEWAFLYCLYKKNIFLKV